MDSYTWTPVLADQQKFTFIISVQTLKDFPRVMADWDGWWERATMSQGLLFIILGWSDWETLHLRDALNVATAEMHYPLPNWAHMCCLVFVNIKLVQTNINGCIFFSDTLWLHITCPIARLPLHWYFCNTAKKKKYELLVGRFNVYCHTTNITLISLANIIN